MFGFCVRVLVSVCTPCLTVPSAFSFIDAWHCLTASLSLLSKCLPCSSNKEPPKVRKALNVREHADFGFFVQGEAKKDIYQSRFAQIGPSDSRGIYKSRWTCQQIIHKLYCVLFESCQACAFKGARARRSYSGPQVRPTPLSPVYSLTTCIHQ
jgi:hypothetical protein